MEKGGNEESHQTSLSETIFMRQLGVFAKYWQPGAVKTRLASAIGEEKAADLYKAFLTATLRRGASVADQRTLVFWPPEREALMAALGGAAWHLQPQSEGDLGERMQSFFAAAFGNHMAQPQQASENQQQTPASVVLIGSDSPSLPMEFIEQAFARLREVPVVLGPSDDGGYYLIGLSQPRPELFENIAWSTPNVLEQTQTRLKATDTAYELLPRWYDVDELADVERLTSDLTNGIQQADPHLRELAAAATAIISGSE